MVAKHFWLAAALLSTPVSALAQSVVTYRAPTGSVDPTVFITMNLTGGGNAYLSPGLNGCYLGQTCAFSGSLLSYSLPDGTTASLHNFTGKFAPLTGTAYEVTGRASGTNSAGHKVIVWGLKMSMSITCRRGCNKTYLTGKFNLTTK
jgi:hypothetical protein